MSQLYESLIVEIRPRLRSCNVFMIVKCDTPVKVDLGSDRITISNDGASEHISIPNCRIIPDSMSCLEIESRSISFRFLTETANRTVGRFTTEVLLFPEETRNTVATTKDKLVNNVSYTISCINCLNGISKVVFERVLPLPSENVDPSEWFCHPTGGGTLSLEPKIDDCFYSSCYVHFNKNSVNGIRFVNDIIICNRCLTWLGSTVKSAVRLWFTTVLFESESFKSICNPLGDFFTTLRTILNNSLLNSCKIMLECQSQPDKTDYLLLWVLEKKLTLYVNGCCFKLKDNNPNFIQVSKVLFKFINEKCDLLDYWQQDVNVNTANVSKPMMITGMNYLYEMCDRIPNGLNKSNDFYVSYLMLWDHG